VTPPSPTATTATPLTQALALGQQVVALQRQALAQLEHRLDEHFTQAIALLQARQGRVILTGMGKSGLIAQKIAATLSSTGTAAYFLHPAEGRHGDLGQVQRGDVVIAISYSGETEELLGLLPTLSHLHVPIVALVGKATSTLAKHSTVALDISVEREACPLNLAPTSSTTVTLVLGDAIALVLQQLQGFKAEDFALYHPAGSLGKRLLLKVEHLMHHGEALPLCTEETPFLEALGEVSRKQLGVVLVLNTAKTQLVGVLTDGDVRRALQQNDPHLSQHPVGRYCGQHPKRIAPSAMAHEALQLMETHHISTLVVQEENQELPVGVLHLHDLLSNGL
jgi:arabinose-5-phosphate isomerase